MKGLTSILLTALAFNCHADINNQFEIGFGDLSGLDDAFLGAKYRYYLDDLETLAGPHEIKAHLNRVDNLALGGFANDNVSYINADGTYYGPKGMVLGAGVQYLNGDDFSDSFINVSLGKQINEQLQIGISVYHSRSEQSYYDDTKHVDVEWTYAPYFRWTGIEKNQGWDLEVKQLAGRHQYIQSKATYYFSQDWSAGLVANIRDSSRYSDNYEFQTQYWFTQHYALKLGLGSSFESGAGLNSASLLFFARW